MRNVKTFCDTYYQERKNTESVKWDGMLEPFGESELLPLWVADMDFRLPDEVLTRLQDRINHGIFGYSQPSVTYYDTFIQWQKKRHDLTIEKEWIRFTTGVVAGFNYLIQAFTKEEEAVMVLAPVYYPFYDAIKANNRTLVAPLLSKNKNRYDIDFADLEAQLVAHKVKLLLHCSPHNPVGRVWSLEETEQLMEICYRHDILVISDEIHQDFIHPDKVFTSMLHLDDKYHSHLFVVTAASKTFNIAGLLHSHVIIPDEKNRQCYDTFAERSINNVPSLMGMIATEACYQYGEEWLEGLLEVIEYNYHEAKKQINQVLPHARIMDKEGTYLMWVDLGAYLNNEEMVDIIQKRAKVAVDYGEWFGEESSSYIRINLATSYENIRLAINRISKEIHNK